MSKLTIKIALVLLPVIVVVTAFEIVARKVPTTYSTKLSYFNAKKDQIEILVMGSSHSNYGINPEYFGRKGYNLSNTSQGIYQDYKLLLKYLPECKNVKMVIIPISYFSLQYDMALSPEPWRCAYYSFYMGVQADPFHPKNDLKNYSALFLWDGPLQVINGMLKTKRMNINEFGYQAPEKPQLNIGEIINDEEGRKRVVSHDKTMSTGLIDHNVRALDGIAKELKKRNIKMVFVVTPVFKTYQQHISYKNYEVMTNTIDMVSKKYSAPYFNYFYDSRFGMSDYSDNDHLNAGGAKKLSVILKNEVIDKLM